MKAVCLKVGVTKPKKPNSGERKIARVRLSNGTPVTVYIPGEGRDIFILMGMIGMGVDCLNGFADLIWVFRAQCTAAFCCFSERGEKSGLSGG